MGGGCCKDSKATDDLGQLCVCVNPNGLQLLRRRPTHGNAVVLDHLASLAIGNTPTDRGHFASSVSTQTTQTVTSEANSQMYQRQSPSFCSTHTSGDAFVLQRASGCDLRQQPSSCLGSRRELTEIHAVVGTETTPGEVGWDRSSESTRTSSAAAASLPRGSSPPSSRESSPFQHRGSPGFQNPLEGPAAGREWLSPFVAAAAEAAAGDASSASKEQSELSRDKSELSTSRRSARLVYGSEDSGSTVPMERSQSGVDKDGSLEGSVGRRPQFGPPGRRRSVMHPEWGEDSSDEEAAMPPAPPPDTPPRRNGAVLRRRPAAGPSPPPAAEGEEPRVPSPPERSREPDSAGPLRTFRLQRSPDSPPLEQRRHSADSQPPEQRVFRVAIRASADGPSPPCGSPRRLPPATRRRCSSPEQKQSSLERPRSPPPAEPPLRAALRQQAPRPPSPHPLRIAAAGQQQQQHVSRRRRVRWSLPEILAVESPPLAPETPVEASPAPETRHTFRFVLRRSSGRVSPPTPPTPVTPLLPDPMEQAMRWESRSDAVVLTGTAAEMDVSGECAICHSEYQPSDECGETMCGHRMHKGCLEQWLERQGTCPLCRFDLQKPTCTERR